jgi:hypothetical protein
MRCVYSLSDNTLEKRFKSDATKAHRNVYFSVLQCSIFTIIFFIISSCATGPDPLLPPTEVEDETVVEETVPPVPQELPPEEPPAVEELPSVPVPLAQLVIPPLPEGEEAFIEELLNARNVPALPGPEEVVVPFVGRPGPPRALSERQRRELTIRRIIAAMTPEELIGQLFMPSLPLAPAGGGSVDYNRRVAALIDEVQPGGVILFAHNLRTPEQVRTLVEDL